MNQQEQFFYNAMSDEMKSCVAGVTLSFKQYLGLQQKYLQDLYGDFGNWEISIDRYDNYARQHPEQEGAREIFSQGDVPELTKAELENWLDGEKNDSQLIEELLKSFGMVANNENISQEEYLKVICHCLELLGVDPGKSGGIKSIDRSSLYEWMVNHEGITEVYLQELEDRCKKDRNVSGEFYMLTKIFALICTPGVAFNYDEMTIVTQQPRRFYYRGENAFYGSSKAGLFRGNERTQEKKVIDTLRMNECGFFLDNFDAVLRWKLGNGTVRYGALMQHYGLKTGFMDITSDLKVALFFACCTPCENDPEKWRPLRKEEFKYADSRQDVASLGGDSRYGIVYRNRAELEYMRYLLGKKQKVMREYPFAKNYKENISGEIIPVGYQPFMRGSVQHGYTMLTDESYDMYKDVRFGKFKIRLTEDLCNWIFEEMDCGEKVYPNNDIPHIQRYISKINTTRDFSEASVKTFCQGSKLNYREVKKLLKQHWYSIKNKTYLISQKEIDRINQAYPIEIAESRMEVQPMMNPPFIMTGGVG